MMMMVVPERFAPPDLLSLHLPLVPVVNPPLRGELQITSLVVQHIILDLCPQEGGAVAVKEVLPGYTPKRDERNA